MDKTITYEEIFNALSREDQQELARKDFKVPLELFIKGYNRQPLFDKAFLIEKFRNWARRRREVRNEVATNPAVQKTKIDDPVIIIGLARSGTTFLHRLMLEDPQFIGPMTWEMVEPLPPGRPTDWTECERLQRASKDVELQGFSEGGMDDRHFFRMDTPEECFFILRNYFFDFIDPLPNPHMSELRDFVYNMPEDHVKSTYEFLKMCYQCIFTGNLEGKTLLLKCPLHCLYPEYLLKVFPNAKFIFPYRNAKSIVSSYSSFVNFEWKMMSGTDDSISSGKRVAELFRYSSQRIVNFLQKIPEEQYITFAYTDLVKEPMEIMKKLYSQFFLNFPPKTELLFKRHLEENYQHKHGKVSYKPEDFGITDEVIKENMKEYLEYFADGNEELL